MRRSSSLLASAFLSLLFLSACSSSGSDGASKANISTENYKDLAVAATEGIKEVSSLDNSQASGFSGLLGKPSANTANAPFFGKLTRQLQQATIDCEAGGSFTVPDSFLSGNVGSTTLNNITFTMNNCDNADGEGAISGTFTFTGDVNGNFTIVVSNATIPSEGISNFSGTVTCTQGSFEPNCTFDNVSGTTGFAGEIDNRTYSVSDVSLSGDAVNGFNVDATVTDPDHGTIDIAATGVIFNCTGSQPSAGSITITGADGATATVTFDDCTTFTVSFNGASDSFLWDSI